MLVCKYTCVCNYMCVYIECTQFICITGIIFSLQHTVYILLKRQQQSEFIFVINDFGFQILSDVSGRSSLHQIVKSDLGCLCHRYDAFDSIIKNCYLSINVVMYATPFGANAVPLTFKFRSNNYGIGRMIIAINLYLYYDIAIRLPMLMIRKKHTFEASCLQVSLGQANSYTMIYLHGKTCTDILLTAACCTTDNVTWRKK